MKNYYSKYTVLECVYAKENPLFFKASLESIVKQTLPPDQFVIVCDGPLTEELDKVVNEYERKYPAMVDVLRLKDNVGPGRAARAGFRACRNEIVARMDSDDISCPKRMELELLKINEGFDVVGGTIIEFNESIEKPLYTKIQPQNHDEIVKMSKKRNPINHVTIMYKKSMVLAVGGYNTFRLGEDYSLVISLIQHGAKCANIVEPAVYVRVGEGQISRRSGKMLRKNLRMLRRHMYKSKYITYWQYKWYSFETDVFTIQPGWVKKWLYKNILRKSKKK